MIGVCIVTYNQDQFIAQAIESVLAQKNTGHEVRIYIGNDASTDRTSEVCQEYVKLYPESIVLINNAHNLGLVENTLNVMSQIKKDGCDYIAMLDGDDYWCDDYKLQKQVSFLEEHQDYGLSHTRVYHLTDGKLIKVDSPIPPIGDVYQDMGRFSIGNCSVVFRTSLLKLVSFDDIINQGFLSLDYVMYAIFSASTKFSFIDKYTAVWRRDHVSVSNPQSEAKQIAYLENDMKMWRYLGQLYPDRWPFDSSSWENYKNFRVFSIAFKYNDYELAHSLSSKFSSENKLSMKLKRIAASNRFLFTLWHKLKCFSFI